MAKIKVDFTGVESFQMCAEGEHVVKLVSMEEGTTQDGDTKLSAKFEVTKGGSQGARLFETFTLSQKALFKLKGYLDAIGVKADGKVQINTDNLLGKVCIANVVLEEYNDKERPKIAFYKKLEVKATDEDDEGEEEDFEDEEEVAPPPPKKKEEKKAPAPVKKEEPKKAPPKATKPAVEEDDFEEDDDNDDWDD